MTLIMSVNFSPMKLICRWDRFLPEPYADKSIVFEDKNKTTEQRRLAAEKVEKVFVKDPQVSIGVQQDISDGRERCVRSRGMKAWIKTPESTN